MIGPKIRTQIGTYHVRTMFDDGKLEHVVSETERYGLKVLGLVDGCEGESGWTTFSLVKLGKNDE
jgi:hypothetical protein